MADNLPDSTATPAPSSAVPERNLHRMAGAVGLLLLALAGMMGWQSWVSARDEQIESMRNVLAVVNVAVERYLAEKEASLKGLSQELSEADPALASAPRLAATLDRFQKLHPAFITLTLRRIDGALIAGAQTATQVSPSPRPPPRNGPSFEATLAAVGPETTLLVGRPISSTVDRGRWLVPLRYLVRDAEGLPAALITGGLPVEFLQSFWQAAPLVAKGSVGLLGDDGFLRSRYPVPAQVTPDETYGKARDGVLHRHLRAASQPDRGYVEGPDRLGRADYANTFLRMPAYAATLFVAMPTAEFYRAWWHRAAIPMALLLLFGVATGMAYRSLLKRQARWTSERQRIDEALRLSESRFRGLFETSLDAVLIAHEDGRILSANPAAAHLFGLAEGALQGRPVACVLDVSDPRLEALRRSRARDGQAHGSTAGLHADGHRFEVEAALSSCADNRGERLESWVLRDFSLLRAAEAALRQKALAEQASQAKSAFIARMSHELRTPLNAILGFAELLEVDAKEPVTDAQRDKVRQIRGAGAHLLALINDLLDLSRIEGGHVPMHWEDVDLVEAAREAVRETAADARARRVEVVVAWPSGPAMVRGDRRRVLQVLLNLLSNAIKYNHPLGRVDVAIESARGRIRLTVRDTGLGLSPGQISRLFQPFDRLGREASDVEGTGIGLVIARSLTELMGGELHVQSTAGEGSLFAVDWQAPDVSAAAPLPAAAHPVPDMAMPPNAPTAPNPPQAATRTPRSRDDLAGTVLYIDDDPVNRALMQAFLALRPRVTLHVAETGIVGLALAEQIVPDLLLIDMMMPDMSGLDVLNRLQAHPLLNGVPCVAVSANAMPEEIGQALAAGFDGYLTKPLAAGLLLAEVDRRLLTPVAVPALG